MQTTLRMKERFLSKHELTLLGKSKVVTRDNEGERSRLSSLLTVQLEAQNLHTAWKERWWSSTGFSLC